ncbi:MAG TPA: carbohydrate ABC transporter permease [Thermomicrobiales bacterium]|nr:carbohydrate ABC transporter permease [Thermomicrobiales bacterium]
MRDIAELSAPDTGLAVPPGSTAAGAHRRRLAGRVAAFLIVLAWAVLFIFPVYWMAVTSLKDVSEVFHLPPVWWPAELKWSNYSEALSLFPFVDYAINTLKITVPVTIGTTISSSLVAYGFARLRWPGRDLVFYLVLATLMIPSWVTLVPLYILFNHINWIDTYKPLVVPSFFGDPFSIFLLRQFFLRQPQDLVDAARVDGASHFRVYTQIILPLARPALAVVALFAFIASWTDFFGPLIYLTNENKYTLQLGLFNFFAQHFVNWPGFMAASLVVLAPMALLFFLTQRTFIEGITFTGLRG